MMMTTGMQACVKVGDGSRSWNLAMQRHMVYVAAALHRPVGELRVLLLDAPAVEADGRPGPWRGLG